MKNSHTTITAELEQEAVRAGVAIEDITRLRQVTYSVHSTGENPYVNPEVQTTVEQMTHKKDPTVFELVHQLRNRYLYILAVPERDIATRAFRNTLERKLFHLERPAQQYILARIVTACNTLENPRMASNFYRTIIDSVLRDAETKSEYLIHDALNFFFKTLVYKDRNKQSINSDTENMFSLIDSDMMLSWMALDIDIMEMRDEIDDGEDIGDEILICFRSIRVVGNIKMELPPKEMGRKGLTLGFHALYLAVRERNREKMNQALAYLEKIDETSECADNILHFKMRVKRVQEDPVVDLEILEDLRDPPEVAINRNIEEFLERLYAQTKGISANEIRDIITKIEHSFKSLVDPSIASSLLDWMLQMIQIEKENHREITSEQLNQNVDFLIRRMCESTDLITGEDIVIDQNELTGWGILDVLLSKAELSNEVGSGKLVFDSVRKELQMMKNQPHIRAIIRGIKDRNKNAVQEACRHPLLIDANLAAIVRKILEGMRDHRTLN